MMNSTEKSLPEKLSDDIIAYILEEQLQPNDKLPNESVLSEKMGAGRSSIREAMKLGDRVLVMDQGRALQNDTPRNIYRSPASDFVRQLTRAGSGAEEYGSFRVFDSDK